MSITPGKFLLTAFFVLIFFAMLWNYFNHTYIKAQFKKMDPMPTRMPVYYKGYKIGKSTKVKISKDFKTTYLYITLNQRGLHLPKNISVKIKDYNDEIKYVDIIYPTSPMIRFIDTGDVIQGESTLSLNGISDVNQAHLDHLSEKGEALLESATKTTDSLTEMISTITEILEENRGYIQSSAQNLDKSMKNLRQTTANFKELSGKINDGVTREIIEKSGRNIEETTYYLANTTKTAGVITQNFTKTSENFGVLVPKLSVLIDAVQLTICNINEIIIGVGKTMKKKFSGARILFGTAISK